MNLQLSISPELFTKFPDYCRGVVIAHGIHNGSSPEELIANLRSAESALAAQLNPDNLLTHPRIASWREAYRQVGVKPADFRPSVEALARRVIRKDPLPAINTIVDLGNLFSIRYLLPVGAHAIDVLTQDMELRPATGAETFEAFGSDVVEHPFPSEIIFVEDSTVLTRRWTWRQAKHTLVVPETTAVEINVDGLPPVTQEEVVLICEAMAEWVKKYCRGEARVGIVSKESPSLNLG